MTTLYAPAQVIWGRIVANATITPTCWLWRGCVNSKGYGCISSGRKSKTALVHRVAVIVRDGTLADDLTVDHMCGNKRCVRPDHLEVVTGGENTRRRFAAKGYHVGGRCKADHLLTEDNLYRHPRGQLVCRICARLAKGGTTASRIRIWAQANGLQVASRGALSAHVQAAYAQSQQAEAANA